MMANSEQIFTYIKRYHLYLKYHTAYESKIIKVTSTAPSALFLHSIALAIYTDSNSRALVLCVSLVMVFFCFADTQKSV